MNVCIIYTRERQSWEISSDYIVLGGKSLSFFPAQLQFVSNSLGENITAQITIPF